MHLQGCHKGDKVGAEKFSYLDYKNDKNRSHENDDDFDDLLESAVKTYQLNFHVKSSGVLDRKTLTKMAIPRCGVADIVNGTNWMMKTDHHHHYGSGSPFHAVAHYSFFQGSPRWPAAQTHLTYAFLPATRDDAMGPVARAFKTWQVNTHFRFSRVEDSTTANIKIGFANDLATVALHEIGHLLGLGHSEVEGAIMWPAITVGSTKGLHRDDIEGIRVLYNV
ncbi:hypothetical protein ACOSQ4_028229 [Xanthoceras sorbifolium]